jgi:tRNA (cmo5U34)-methyltransferase
MGWDPGEYANSVRTWVHDYDELQDQVAKATAVVRAKLILDLGVGAGETARRVLEIHPEARLVGLDSSPTMLQGAARALPQDRVTLLQQDLGEPFPDQSFDLVISALAVHHLKGEDKAELFLNVARRLHAGGRFVMGDVVIPDDPFDALIENEDGYDFPSTAKELQGWMSEAGFTTEILWICKDLAVFGGDLHEPHR